MTSRGDSELEGLRAAIRELAAEAAPGLVAEARAEAAARVRSMLSDAIARELLDRSADLLGPPAAEPRRSAPRREPERRRPPERPRPAPEQPRRAAPQAGDGRMGCYVYGIVHEAAAEGRGLDGVAGVDGEHATRLISHGGLAALVSDVPLSEFGEEPLLENLNDVEWLERTARGHERVLDVALARTTVVPLRLCTIYNDEEQVRRMLDRERGAMREALDRLTGKTEWGVKVIAAPGSLTAALGDDEGESERPASAGAAYMEARRREARADERIDELALGWAEAVHERLARVAAEALRNPVQQPDIAGYEGEMLLNGVYLVSDADEEAFRQAVRELAEEWAARSVSVELTGPWPPYNFVKSSIEAAR